MPLPTLDVPAVAERHLLALPADTEPADVHGLAVERFPAAAWEVEPSLAPPRRAGGARGLRVLAAPPGLLRLADDVELAGPWEVDDTTAGGLGLPLGCTHVYVLGAPVRRGAVRPPILGDPDGLGRAFPFGVPIGAEGEVLTWAVACARRLGGAVRTADGARTTVLVPDPAAAVDLTVWASVPLPAPVVVDVVDRVTGARARVERATASLGYRVTVGLGADLGRDGTLVVEVVSDDVVPPRVHEVGTVVAHRVRWAPPDPVEAALERPSNAHRFARARATPVVVAVARALLQGAGGLVTDAADLLVEPADL
ncbi:hypothetical protein [Cellulomonas carbonis]|uniref:Uncharacterized protein n=1 Tax=Cellulomonas carbonis T26 TaxID=947969 RepID=A0A0A0BVU3_9CELL|nr:hypothetical protein [Cellulomonas carbonis]KGM12100.1 hypothetical protein N868_02785 [Cellulomonas carbonis T26]GGC08246.1 hypothetical protein GCM10010972_21910 [Cellulomonas carbonis]